MKLSAALPVILFVAYGIYMAIALPNWRDARYVRRPDRRLWGFWHFFDNDEWTPEGLVLRGRYLRSMGVALAVAIVGILIGRVLAERGL